MGRVLDTYQGRRLRRMMRAIGPRHTWGNGMQNVPREVLDRLGDPTIDHMTDDGIRAVLASGEAQPIAGELTPAERRELGIGEPMQAATEEHRSAADVVDTLDAAVVRQKEAGDSREAIAERHGITVYRVRKILAAHDGRSSSSK